MSPTVRNGRATTSVEPTRAEEPSWAREAAARVANSISGRTGGAISSTATTSSTGPRAVSSSDDNWASGWADNWDNVVPFNISLPPRRMTPPRELPSRASGHPLSRTTTSSSGMDTPILYYQLLGELGGLRRSVGMQKSRRTCPRGPGRSPSDWRRVLLHHGCPPTCAAYVLQWTCSADSLRSRRRMPRTSRRYKQ